jgi:cytochrome c-type biogenesis protein CcmH/NrfG
LTVRGLAQAAFSRPEDARPLLERSLAINPGQPMVVKVLAAVYFSDGDMDRGLAMLALAAKLDPSDFRPWYATGDILLRYRDRKREAIGAFREALRRSPDDVGSRTGLAEALLAAGEEGEASPLVDVLLRENPDDPKVLRLAAIRARLLTRIDDVERYAGQVLELDPKDVDTLMIRANARLYAGRPREALDDAERAGVLAPDNLSVLELLSRAEGAMGLKERAGVTGARHKRLLALAERIQQLREEVRKHPNDPQANSRLGQTAAAGGMTTLARRSFRAALALDPKYTPARKGLAALDRTAATP